MTIPLRPDSPRRADARRFGDELRRAMTARRASSKRLVAAIGITTSSLGNYRAGTNLPRLSTARRLAEVLDWPRLVTIVAEGRRGTCARCGREWFNEGGSPKRFCSTACRDVDAQLRAPTAGFALSEAVAAAISDGTTAALPDALAVYRRSDAHRIIRRDLTAGELSRHIDAVAAMCAACEPAGRCRDADCPLRPVSPLRLAGEERPVGVLRPAEGRWGPTHRETTLRLVRVANARRWARPGERERMAAMSRDRFAAMTPEERAEHSRRVSAARRRKDVA